MLSPKPFNLCDHIILRCENDLMVLIFYTPLGFVETFLSPTSNIIGRAPDRLHRQVRRILFVDNSE